MHTADFHLFRGKRKASTAALARALIHLPSDLRSSVASLMALNLYLGRTFQKSAQVDAALEKLTVADVNAALRKYLKNDQWVAAFAGEFKERP